MASPVTIIQLDSVKPGRQFNILAAMFTLNALGNTIPLITDNVNSISYTVYQLLDVLPPEITVGRLQTGSGSFVPSAVLSNTMLTGTAWVLASLPNVAAGYNANFPIPGNCIPLPNTAYEVQITTILTSGNVFDDWYSLRTLNVP